MTSPLTTDGLPADRAISRLWALLAIYLLQDWLRVAQNGHDSSPQWFRRHGLLTAITSENRSVILRLARRTQCLACDEPIANDSTGDHLIAVANGGPASAENYIPLCRRCNVSKRTLDLLEWWQRRERSARELPPDVLACYVRLTYRHDHRTRTIAQSAPAYQLAAVRDLVAELPTIDHRRAVWTRVAWVAGW
jgi:5-methylcytosine-specific restriction endonuclease McrA